MPHDPLVIRRWSDIIPALDAHGLEARFVVAEDESVDDAIEIRRVGAGEDEDLADIQFCDDGCFCGNAWTSEARDARRHGGVHRTVKAAFDDALSLLKRDGMIS